MKAENVPETQAACQVRRFFYELGKAFFLAEPDAEKLAGWREACESLAAEIGDPPLAAAIHRLAGLLATLDPAQIQEEYYDFFVNPFSPRQLNWTTSYYLDGRHFGRHLVELRQLMAATGYVKEEEFKEPEDSLPVLLDLMARLIEAEGEGDEAAAAVQRRVLKDFLAPVVDRLGHCLHQQDGALFYPACAVFLQAWLRLEESYLV